MHIDGVQRSLWSGAQVAICLLAAHSANADTFKEKKGLRARPSALWEEWNLVSCCFLLFAFADFLSSWPQRLDTGEGLSEGVLLIQKTTNNSWLFISAFEFQRLACCCLRV